MQYYTGAFKKYADFSGRARRKEYWMFTLVNGCIIFIPYTIVLMLIINKGLALYMGNTELMTSTAIISFIFSLMLLIYSIAVFLPTLSLQVRRLHDVGYSGAYIFIGLIPLVGGIWMLVLMCTDSYPGSNQYGPCPKQMNYNSQYQNNQYQNNQYQNQYQSNQHQNNQYQNPNNNQYQNQYQNPNQNNQDNKRYQTNEFNGAFINDNNQDNQNGQPNYENNDKNNK